MNILQQTEAMTSLRRAILTGDGGRYERAWSELSSAVYSARDNVIRLPCTLPPLVSRGNAAASDDWTEKKITGGLLYLNKIFPKVEYDPRDRCLVCTTGKLPMTCERAGVSVVLGPVEIAISEKLAINVYSTPGAQTSPAGYFHPHVSGSSLCIGEGGGANSLLVHNARRDQDLFTLISIYHNILQIYNLAGGPHERLEQFSPSYVAQVECGGCRHRFASDTLVACAQCGTHICRGCRNVCLSCREVSCRTCATGSPQPAARMRRNTNEPVAVLCSNCVIHCVQCNQAIERRGRDENIAHRRLRVSPCMRCACWVCVDCAVACKVCGVQYCATCVAAADGINSTIGFTCRSCLTVCKQCERPYQAEDILECAGCGIKQCYDCLVTHDNQVFCKECADERQNSN